MQISDISYAIELYYSKIEIGNTDIRKLFGVGDNLAIRLKKEANLEMSKSNVLAFDYRNVNTECAYRAWGINIEDLERRYDKLCRFRKKQASLSQAW